MTRLVIFDVDGTLIDSQHLIVAAMADAFGTAGHPLPERDRLLGVVGLSLHEAMAALAPHLPDAETLLLVEHYRDSFVAQRAAGGDASRAPLYPGALDALGRLSAAPDTLLGVATGKARRGLDHLFETFPIGHLFATTQTADGHPSKPHPSMLHAALAETGVEAGAVGDGRRHRVRHRHGPGRRHGDGRRRLGLSSARPARSGRRRCDRRGFRRSRRGARPPRGRRVMLVQRRFWNAAAVVPEGTGFGVRLDDRPLRTPAGVALAVPTEALAAAIAAEWDALEGEIQPALLPFTRAANAAIDRVAATPGPVVAAVADYGATDLLCYRAAEPAALAARQAAAWDPWLLWSAKALGAPLVAVTGVMFTAQPEASLTALRAAVAAEDAFGLTALAELVSISGSLVLGLAVAQGALAAPAAWEVSRIDEIWQAEQWGLDSEAEAAAAVRGADFLRAARFGALASGAETAPIG